MVLTALGFALVLAYAGASAAIARNGYAEMQLRQEIEELRARTALLRYQNHRDGSSAQVRATAERLGLVMSEVTDAVDYVRLPYSAPAQVTRLAVAPAGERPSLSLSSAISEFATEVSAGGQAEASTDSGHRR